MSVHQIYGTRNPLLLREEDVLKYRLGGYHPVVLGDVLKDGRYKIYHKIGYGGFSTVWAARDSDLERWVSVKIMTADETKRSRERNSLKAISAYSQENPGSKYIVTLLDDFIHYGPNGCHQCLVFELHGPTINLLVECYQDERLEPETILRMATQLLQALAFLHEAGFAHGDLNIRNIVFNIPRLSHLPEDKLMRFLGPPELEELIRVDGAPLEKGVPKYLVKTVEWAGWPSEDDDDCDYDEDEEDDIRLIDLGEAFPRDVIPQKLAQPSGLQAPETLLIGDFDYRVDLWRAGLIIYYLVFGSFPFQYFYVEDLVDSMVNLLGHFPQEWLPHWEKLILQGKGDIRAVSERAYFPEGESRLVHRFKGVHEAELKVLLPVIQGLTRFLPSDRISASQALNMIEEKGSNDYNIEMSTESSDSSSSK